MLLSKCECYFVEDCDCDGQQLRVVNTDRQRDWQRLGQQKHVWGSIANTHSKWRPIVSGHNANTRSFEVSNTQPVKCTLGGVCMAGTSQVSIDCASPVLNPIALSFDT